MVLFPIQSTHPIQVEYNCMANRIQLDNCTAHGDRSHRGRCRSEHVEAMSCATLRMPRRRATGAGRSRGRRGAAAQSYRSGVGCGREELLEQVDTEDAGPRDSFAIRHYHARSFNCPLFDPLLCPM